MLDRVVSLRCAQLFQLSVYAIASVRCVQLASYLERSPLMWMMLLHLHVNLNDADDADDDDDDDDNDVYDDDDDDVVM